MKLSISDYKKILKFYKLSVPKNKKKLEKKANKIIADKFCSCIKKVQQKFREEGIAIGICTNSVINRKGYKRGKFKCKKRRTINLHKGGKRKKKTRKKRGKGATISRLFVEPDYTWNVQQFEGDYYIFGAAEEALESYMNEYGSPPHTREYQLHRLEQQRRIIDDFHNSRDNRWQQHLARARQQIFQQMGNEPQLPQARTEEDFLHLMQNNPYSSNQSPPPAAGGKRKRKTRRKRGKGGVFSCKNCGDKKKKKERDFYYEDGVKKYFYDSDYSSDSDSSNEDLKSMVYYEKKSIKEQPNKRPVSPLLSEKEQQDARLSPTFGQFAEISRYEGGKRRRKTRKKRGGMKRDTPQTRPNTPTTVEPEQQQAPFIPPIALPPPAIPQRPTITSFNANVRDESFEDVMLFNMRQAIIGSTDAEYIFNTLALYLDDYNRRVEDRQFTPQGDFGELLNNDVNSFRNYVQYLNQSGGCFPNCKKIKKKCVGCLKPARVEPTPLGVVMDNNGTIIQHGRSSLGVEISDEDGPYNIWILNRRIARLNSEGKQIQKQIEEAGSPFQKGQLLQMFDNKKKEWEQATKQLKEEEEKIAATPVAYPGEPVAMRR